MLPIHHSHRVTFALVAILLALMGCSSAGVEGMPTSDLVIRSTPPATATNTSTPRSTATTAPTSTVSPTPTPVVTPSPTPDPYEEWTIDYLVTRKYGAGEIRIERTLETNDDFTRLLIAYPGDGLTIYGFMNVPHGEGPFPVTIVVHGYIDPAVYQTLAYTTHYANALARAGYIAIHPNLRGYPPSDDGPNRFRVGMAVDVLNLIGLVRNGAGDEGPLANADAAHIGIMGHSMGGGITIRVITVDPGIGAAVLYGPMHADERINHQRMMFWSGGERGWWELSIPEEDMRRISPSEHLERIVAPVSIHHSADDMTAPVEWADDIARRMEAAGVSVELYHYSGTPHTFRGAADQLFMQRLIAFFDRHLRVG